MKALVYPEWGLLEIADQPMPEPQEHEVRLEVAACGICGSELETFKSRSLRRPPPLIMGHEFCGIIDKLGGAVSGFTVGQKVVSNAIVPCGDCAPCRRRQENLCVSRQVFGMHRPGALAEYVSVPAHCLIPWPESLPAQAAALSEPLANGIHVVNLIGGLQPETALVLGAGPIGLMCQQALQVLLGTETLVADLLPDRLRVSAKLGASRVLQADRNDVGEAVKEFTRGAGVDLAVDAVGNQVTREQSLAVLRAGGTAVWIGLHENRIAMDSYAVTLAEKRVLGSYGAILSEMRTAVEMMVRGRVDVISWVQTFSLDHGVAAFERMLAARGTDIKAVVVP